jgi:UDP-N-acetyl-D-mannosaminuronic acid dehydrogenase
MSSLSRLAVIGLGYVGLPTAACIAAAGLDVIGVDIDPVIVEQVNRGEAPAGEPGLAEPVNRAVADGRLKASTQVAPADGYIIAVPTPLVAGCTVGTPDLSCVYAAVAAVAAVLDEGEIVVIESTVPPGTTRRVGTLIAAKRPDLRLPDADDVHHRSTSDLATADVAVAHCPERVLPGRVMTEITANDRLIGGLTPECTRRAAAIYQTFCTGELTLTDADSAEMAKLAENAYRDVNIAFANELTNVCDQLGLDIWHVREIANKHPRVNILRPGPGVGGHCVAVDPWFIADAAPGGTPLIQAARAVNDGRPERVASQIAAAVRKVGARRIGVLGLTFKADVADLRGSPAVEVTRRIAAELPEVTILVADPLVISLPAALADLANVVLASTDQAMRDAELIALLTDHASFRSVTPADLAGKAVLDTRGIWR